MSKEIRLGFNSTFGTAEKFFTWALGHRFDVEVVPPAECDYLIFGGDGTYGHDHQKFTNCSRIMYTGENFRPNYFQFDHAMTFDHENSPRHYRLPLWVLEMHMMVTEGMAPSFDYLISRRENASLLAVPEGFCTFIQSNPNNPIRNGFFDKLNSVKPVDSAGPLKCNRPEGPLPRDIRETIKYMRTRKFSISFENGVFPGYCTEKPLNAFYADVIPIYLGSSTVYRDFNTDRFINCHEFENLNDVVEMVMDIEQDPKAWLSMVQEPVFPNDKLPACGNIDNLNDWWETFVL